MIGIAIKKYGRKGDGKRKKRSDGFVCEIEANHQSRGFPLGLRLEIDRLGFSRINHQDKYEYLGSTRPEARQKTLDWIRMVIRCDDN